MLRLSETRLREEISGLAGGAANTLQQAPRGDRKLKAVIALMLMP
jgi:hypothetical protein